MKTNMMQLSKFVKWSVAGDGFVGYATHNTNGFYSISRAPKHMDYILKIRDCLSLLPDCNVRITELTRKDNGKDVVQLRTTSHPLFSRVRKRQYIQGRRVIDPHMLTLLDWEAAANLYMDDGSLCWSSIGSSIVRLSTCAYSYPEQESLVRTFQDKLGVTFNINKASKGLYQLNLAKGSQEKWFENVRPFIVPSYNYKLPEFSQKETPRTGGDLVYPVDPQEVI